ncbi:hypothetical protein H0H87_011890 [Tephrocybe sp. NHM501043]|nr:hypothetical protein H0H87_011890 [Tephrocybe sp. NHM501043]
MSSSLLHLLSTQILVAFTLSGLARATSTIPQPRQPTHNGVPGQFELLGESLVSAQQLFLGTENNVFIVDKVENNPVRIDGHPAWASGWTLDSNAQRPMDAVTNTFCAGGNVMGNGTWVNIGGNQAVTYAGDAAASQFGGGPYDDPDGRKSNGGYVNDARQDNPTYEFFPPTEGPITLPILQRTLPANLYPLTWLLPSGRLLIQSNWETVLYDYKKQRETPLEDIPDAVRTYPASAGTVMLPLTPANNWTATVLFCGGSDVQPDRWMDRDWIIPTYPASTSCVRLTPDVAKTYEQDDPLPEPRSMGNLIALPNGKILCLNGAKMGTAGYGNQSWAVGMSYADSPALTPVVYDPAAPAGKRWSRDGLSASKIPRMYHSSATLLPDGSVFVSGSNPNSDYNVGPTIKYPTEYRTERFYPSYYNERRPQPAGILAQLSYGGSSFTVSLDSEDLFGDVNNVKDATVVVIRPGFSTHSMNMGQRFLQLENTYRGYAANNSAVLYVSQIPPNPAIIAPGPAFVFVVVKGVPSVGVKVMIGSGDLGKQEVLPIGDLPQPLLQTNVDGSSSNTGSNGASRVGQQVHSALWLVALLVVILSPWAFTNAVATPTEPRTPTVSAPVPRAQTATMHVKRVTLTSKKNWWMVEMDEEDEKNSVISGDEIGGVDPKLHYMHGADEHSIDHKRTESPPPSPIYNPPRHPTSIFSFPTPTAYSAPPNPTASMTPCARGSASELFKCVVKKPDVIQLEINGDMHSNASDVTVQFLAELRVYTTLARHRNICAFLGSLENVGMVLEYLDGRTLYDVVIARPSLTEAQKIDYHNQLLDGLTHLHSYGLSHGDLSLLNVQVISPGDTVKLLDFGRSVSAESVYRAPDDEPVDPFDELHRKASEAATPSKVPSPKIEQIHPGTRPFSAPEILRGECQDARLADAYSFGMILVCLDRCESVDVKPWEQRLDQLPLDFFKGCVLFEQRAKEYLRKCTEGRRRLKKEDIIDTGHLKMDEDA